MNWYTSDMHFYHKNVIEYEKRPFPNINHMNQAIISNWNKKINEEDHIWILGDVAFVNHPDFLKKILSSLKGIKHLILGNHDNRYRPETWEKIGFFSVHTKMIFEDRILVHNPNHLDDLKFDQKLILHGHWHSKFPKINEKNDVIYYNVGVDVNEFYPVNERTIQREISLYKINKNSSKDKKENIG